MSVSRSGDHVAAASAGHTDPETSAGHTILKSPVTPIPRRQPVTLILRPGAAVAAGCATARAEPRRAHPVRGSRLLLTLSMAQFMVVLEGMYRS